MTEEADKNDCCGGEERGRKEIAIFLKKIGLIVTI